MKLTDLLHPELRGLAPDEKAWALREARATPFDIIELVGMAAAVVLVTALTDYAVSDVNGGQRLVAAILNYAMALPFIAAAVAPFLYRRTRRGLQQRHQRGAGHLPRPPKHQRHTG